MFKTKKVNLLSMALIAFTINQTNLSATTAHQDAELKFNNLQEALSNIESETFYNSIVMNESNNPISIDERTNYLPALYPNGWANGQQGSGCPNINIRSKSGKHVISRPYQYFYSRDCKTVYVAPPSSIETEIEDNGNGGYKYCERYELALENQSLATDRVYQNLARISESEELLYDTNISDTEALKLEKKITNLNESLDKAQEHQSKAKEEVQEYYIKDGLSLSFILDLRVTPGDLHDLTDFNTLTSSESIGSKKSVVTWAPTFRELPVQSTLVYDYSGFFKYNSKGDLSGDNLEKYKLEANPIKKVSIGGQSAKINHELETVSKLLPKGEVTGTIYLNRAGTCEYLKQESLSKTPSINVFHKANVFTKHGYTATFDNDEKAKTIAVKVNKTSGTNQSSNSDSTMEATVIDISRHFKFNFFAESKGFVEMLKTSDCSSMKSIEVPFKEDVSDEVSSNDIEKNSTCSFMDILENSKADMMAEYLQVLEKTKKIEFKKLAEIEKAKAHKYIVHIPQRYCRRRFFRKKCRTKMVPVVKIAAVKNESELAQFMSVGANLTETMSVNTPLEITLSTAIKKLGRN